MIYFELLITFGSDFSCYSCLQCSS